MRERNVRRSVTQYVEAEMFCVLEELRFVVAEATRMLCSFYHVALAEDKSAGSKTASNTEPSAELNTEMPALAGHSKHDFEMLKGTVTLVGDDNGDFVRLRVDRGGATPYKWNEAVVLLAASELGSGARPAMVYGVSYAGGSVGEGTADSRKECVVYMRMTEEAKKVIRTGKVVFAYSLTPFTSFIR